MGLFEPDILNEAAHRGRHGAPPEQRLMIAILTDAIDCLRKNTTTQNRKRRRLYSEAEQWILSDDIGWVFSFRNICDVLGVDAQALRAQAASWKRFPSQQVVATDRLEMAS